MPDAPSLIDAHGRGIRYLRISVTDRCDLRCRYCMAEKMTFLPRSALLQLEEIAVIAERFIARAPAQWFFRILGFEIRPRARRRLPRRFRDIR